MPLLICQEVELRYESCRVAVNTDEALITSLSLAFCGEAWFPNRPYTQGVERMNRPSSALNSPT